MNWLEDVSENPFTRFVLGDKRLSNNEKIIARLFFEVKKKANFGWHDLITIDSGHLARNDRLGG